MTENKTTDNDLREKTLKLILKWRDDAREMASMYKLSEIIFTEVEKNAAMAKLCLDMKAQAESNALRMEKIIIDYNAPKP